MSLATPVRVPLSTPRPAVLALLPAGAVAVWGLGLAGAALIAPPPEVVPLPAPSARAAPAGSAPTAPPAAPAAPPAGDWAPLFGPLAPEPEPTPEAEPEAELFPALPLDDFDADAFILRGLVVGDGDDGALAVIETGDGMQILRVGDWLADEYRVLSIDAEGVEIAVGDEALWLHFDENAPRPAAAVPRAAPPTDAALARPSFAAPGWSAPPERRPDGPDASPVPDRFGLSR